MKLVFPIVGDSEADKVAGKLIEAGFRLTRLVSSGGFLRRGNMILLLGMPAEKVDEALGVMRAALAFVTDPGSRRGLRARRGALRAALARQPSPCAARRERRPTPARR
jgi:uncharacterized protein YaaQ